MTDPNDYGWHSSDVIVVSPPNVSIVKCPRCGFQFRHKFADRADLRWENRLMVEDVSFTVTVDNKTRRR